MKNNKLTLIGVVMLCSAVMFSSCIGSFRLSNKLLAWNHTIGSKFANQLVFFVFWVLPVYEITILLDVVVLNSIEFWGGNSPVAEGGPSVKEIRGENGDYIVKRSKDGYRITHKQKKTTVELRYDEATRSWSAVQGDKQVTFMTMLDGNRVRMHLPDGSATEVTLDEAGVMAYRQAIGYDLQFAER